MIFIVFKVREKARNDSFVGRSTLCEVKYMSQFQTLKFKLYTRSYKRKKKRTDRINNRTHSVFKKKQPNDTF